jgi:hypothetical protein
VFVIFVMTVAAAEAAVGLAIIIAIFRHRQSVNLDDINSAEGLMQVEHASTGHPLADTVARFALGGAGVAAARVRAQWVAFSACGWAAWAEDPCGGHGHGNGGHHRGDTEGTENGDHGHGHGHDDHGTHDHPVRHAAARARFDHWAGGARAPLR